MLQVTGWAARFWIPSAAWLVGLTLASGCATNRLWAPSRERLLERILPPAVQLILEQDGSRFRSGSGVVIAARPSDQGVDCYVLTSGHNLRSGGEDVYVLLDRHRGGVTKTRATVLALRDTDDLDLGLLRVTTGQCAVARLGEPPHLGEEIWVVAFPWGRNMTLLGGIVSQVNVDDAIDQETAPRLIVDTSVSYGASGAGVYQAKTGRLIGLVEGYRTARVSFRVDAHPGHIDVPVPGETYLTPLAHIRRFLAETGYSHLVGQPPAMPKPAP